MALSTTMLSKVSLLPIVAARLVLISHKNVRSLACVGPQSVVKLVYLGNYTTDYIHFNYTEAFSQSTFLGFAVVSCPPYQPSPVSSTCQVCASGSHQIHCCDHAHS